MYIGGEWVDRDEKTEVINPYDGSVIDTAPSAGLEDLDMASDTNYGLSTGIFTQNVDWAMRFAKEVDSGNLHVNSGPAWRADLMPYGGLKESGTGKEGPRYAVQEMTELKMVVFHS
jgi:acyl-CoA reductase-like NAD-dependent aldehyde dehydrogenase